MIIHRLSNCDSCRWNWGVFHLIGLVVFLVSSSYFDIFLRIFNGISVLCFFCEWRKISLGTLLCVRIIKVGFIQFWVVLFYLLCRCVGVLWDVEIWVSFWWVYSFRGGVDDSYWSYFRNTFYFQFKVLTFKYFCVNFLCLRWDCFFEYLYLFLDSLFYRSWICFHFCNCGIRLYHLRCEWVIFWIWGCLRVVFGVGIFKNGLFCCAIDGFFSSLFTVILRNYCFCL